MSIFLDGQSDPDAVMAALEGEAVCSAFLLELRFKSGTNYLSNLAVRFTDTKWGRIWQGLGDLVGMSEIVQSQDDLAPLREYTLGLPWKILTEDEIASNGMGRIPELIGNRAEFIGREANLFLQLFDPTAHELTPIGHPFALDSGLMDKVTGSMTRDAAVLTLRVEGLMARKGAPIYGVLTDRDQQTRSPGDRGLENVVEVNNTKVVWTDW